MSRTGHSFRMYQDALDVTDLLLRATVVQASGAGGKNEIALVPPIVSNPQLKENDERGRGFRPSGLEQRNTLPISSPRSVSEMHRIFVQRIAQIVTISAAPQGTS